ncbi:6-O-methylguanine DNA methyltransferase [Amylostereum chailletii]|nr:6-O-methylguanine DNA methyltransferase [Amylostereum chailletii]
MSLDAAEFYAEKVTTYGHIAKLIGMPRHSRHVGQALKWLSPDAVQPVPWQRVISSSGAISSRGPGTDGAQRQRNALEAEGVSVNVGRTGELLVNLKRYGWFPDAAAVAPLAEASGDAEGEVET